MYYEEGKRSSGTYSDQDFEVKSYSGAGAEKSGVKYGSTSQESKVCDLANIFGVFNIFWSPESQSKNSAQDDQSRAVGNADSRRNKFEAVRRFTPVNGGAGNPPPSPRQGSFRGDAFKNVKLNPELEATRRRVEEELYIKNLKAAEIEEDKSRRAKSPLYAIGRVFGFDASSPSNSSNPSTPRKTFTASELETHANGSSAAASSSGRFFGITESRTSGKGGPGSAGARSVASDSNRSARSDSVRSTKSLASQGGEKSTQEAFERVLGTSGLEVTVYLTSRDGQTKSKRAAIKRERNSSTVYIELKHKSSRGGVGGLGSAEKDTVKKLKFDLAIDVMMVAKGKGSGRGPHDAKVPRSVDDNSVLHFVLKGKPELNVEVDGGLDSRDAVLMGFMQLISRHRSMNSSNSSGKNGAAAAAISTSASASTSTPASNAGSGSMSISGFFS